MESDATRMCELFVGLPDVNVLSVDDTGEQLIVAIEVRGPRPACLGCGMPGWVKDRDEVLLVDLPVFGRPSRLLWRKHRWKCITDSCAMNTWTLEMPAITPWRDAIKWATLDLSGPHRLVFSTRCFPTLFRWPTSST